MSEVTIGNPSDYQMTEEQFKAQEKKYMDDEAKSLKEAAEKEASSHPAAIEDSLATVNGEMQNIKKMQMEQKAQEVQKQQMTAQSTRVVAIAKILATAPTDEEQKDRLEALDGKKPSVAQKPAEKKNDNLAQGAKEEKKTEEDS